jgi:tetratricopeptide (TPR) repeat protein
MLKELLAALGQQRRTPRRRSSLALLAGVVLLAVSPIPAAALTDEQEALLSARQGALALGQGRFSQAETLLSAAVDGELGDVGQLALVLKNRGATRWMLGSYREALADFNKAIEFRPHDASLYNNRGIVLLALGATDEAVKDFDFAIALNPTYAAAYNNRGNARLRSENATAALADFGKAIELLPHHAVPLNGRGQAQLMVGRPYGALRDFARAIEIDGDYAEAFANRAESLTTVARYDEALKDYDEALKLKPAVAAFYLGRGRTLARMGRVEAALDATTRAIDLDPASAAAFAERGALHLERGSYAAAESDLAKAATLDPNSATAVAYQALLLLRKKHGPAALLKIAEALKLDPASAVAFKVRGEIESVLGQHELAQADFEKARRYGAREQESAGSLTGLAGGDAGQSEPIALELEGWRVLREPSGEFVAENAAYPNIRLSLEMYGEGEPHLLDWATLKGALEGTGLLRYHAGTAPDGEPLEYTAVVDTKRGRLVGIEPSRWGDQHAEWNWESTAVVVEDPQGVRSRLQVRREPLPRPQPVRRSVAQEQFSQPAPQEPPPRRSEPVLPNASGFLSSLFN